MKIEQESPIIKDPETEAAEFESMLRDVNKSIAQSCSRPGKSGLTFEQFKAQFFKKLSQAGTPFPAHVSH